MTVEEADLLGPTPAEIEWIAEELLEPSNVRPLPPGPPPRGYRWAVARDDAWELVAPDDARPCRAGNHQHGHCRKPSVARLNRGRQEARTAATPPSWWHYCAEHLYGRWIERGRLYRWRLEPAAR